MSTALSAADPAAERLAEAVEMRLGFMLQTDSGTSEPGAIDAYYSFVRDNELDDREVLREVAWRLAAIANGRRDTLRAISLTLDAALCRTLVDRPIAFEAGYMKGTLEQVRSAVEKARPL